MKFEDAVLKAAVNTARIVGVVVRGTEVSVKYLSGSGKTENAAKLLFDDGKCTAIYGAFKNANAPKALADNIEKLWRNDG